MGFALFIIFLLRLFFCLLLVNFFFVFFLDEIFCLYILCIDLKGKGAKLPVVQLPPIHPLTQEVHDPFVCRQWPCWQLGEHTREQFVPKYPSLQAKN